MKEVANTLDRKICSCYRHVTIKSITKMLNVPYHRVYNVLRKNNLIN
jgi:hypothetical protein